MTWPEGTVVRPKFVWARSPSLKMRCVVCGRSGYADGRWMLACTRGHPYRCACGDRKSSAGSLAQHRRRQHRPDPQQGETWP